MMAEGPASSTSVMASSPVYLLVRGLSSDSDQNGDFQVMNRSKIFKRKRKTETVEEYQAPNRDEPDFSDDSHYDDGEDTVEWDPDMSLTCGDDSDVIVVNIHNSEGAILTTLRNDTSLQSSATEDPLCEPQISEEELQSTQILLDTVLDSSPEDALPVNSGSQVFSSDSPEDSVDLERISYVSVRRVVVVRDLVQAFMDNSIMHSTVKMKFVNEMAVDDAGVSRDVYTAFWEQFFELCEGETERVPRLTPDFGEAEWRAVGLIWVKGLMDHGVIPVMLAQSFIVACIHGIDAVDDNDLITSFLNYLSPIEKSVIERALQGTSEQSDEEDLLDIFSRMGSHTLLAKEDMQLAIKTMAHKAILQEATYVIDCFSTQMAHVKVLLPDKESVVALYESKKTSGKKVSQLFEPSKAVLTQMEQVTFSHLQRYAKNADQTKAEKLLRFCTGSTVIAVDKIIVSFNRETGLNRRPVSHTCGQMLEVPCTYSSYPDFRTEFDNILASSCWEMDIV
ncbi:uncharacterized protein LOC115421612 [Sphaeramia orbicularis]|uniref:uncharacterized protein LOC115421612 n=1 Tax=Sphaeramia orbicularis TaxID=375764 RepID=UPI00117DB328|nr:uncharacterized protein LOC115421612 [Sphaeramia orbicularis]